MLNRPSLVFSSLSSSTSSSAEGAKTLPCKMSAHASLRVLTVSPSFISAFFLATACHAASPNRGRRPPALLRCLACSRETRQALAITGLWSIGSTSKIINVPTPAQFQPLGNQM